MRDIRSRELLRQVNALNGALRRVEYQEQELAKVKDELGKTLETAPTGVMYPTRCLDIPDATMTRLYKAGVEYVYQCILLANGQWRRDGIGEKTIQQVADALKKFEAE